MGEWVVRAMRSPQPTTPLPATTTSWVLSLSPREVLGCEHQRPSLQ